MNTNPPNPMQNINIGQQMERARDAAQNTGEAVAQTFTSVTGNLKQTTDDLFDSFRNGTAVITTDCGSFNEFVIQNETGYVFNINEFITSSLNVIKESNLENNNRLSNNCLNYFMNELSDFHFENKLINFLNTIK